MKKITVILASALAVSTLWAESILKPINELGYGTFSGRIQSLSMYRDFEGVGNGGDSSLGIILEYTSPEWKGLDGGVAYNYAWEWFDHNDSDLLANNGIHLFNEAWLRYNLGVLDLTNTTVLAGRKINNGEVFRADDFRQKSRSLEMVQVESTDLANHHITVGHALRMSNWIQVGDRWDFNDFGDVFGANYDTDGITWGEVVNSSIEGLELAVFDAYAWDISNLAGTRAKWAANEKTALLGYYRHEGDVGKAASCSAHAYGLSLQQKIGVITLEPGFFSVHGGDLRFQELSTGINHALGSSMMVYAQQFNGGADTIYLKAVAKIKKTTLYGLYNYTWQDKRSFDGQELNLVVKQQITDHFSVAVKGGVGYRDAESGNNTTATDARLFLTYTF